MKLLVVLPLAATLLAHAALAQAVPGEGLSLIPEVPAVGEKLKKRVPVPLKKSSTEQTSDDLQARIRFRQAKTKAMQDPRLQAEWDQAQAAKTDLEKRETLQRYYALLFDRMIRLDASVKPRVELERKTTKWRLEQRGIRLTEPLELEPEPPALSRF